MRNGEQLGPIDPDRYYRGPEVCSRLSINHTTLWRWRKRGLIEPAVIAGIPRYAGRDILAMIDQRPASG